MGHATRLGTGVFSVFIAISLIAPSGGQAEETDVLRIALPNAPSGMDPHLDPTSVGDAVFFNIFETLLVVDAQGLEQPVLATSWTKEGDNAWTLKIRQGVRFHNGRALTAADVVASIDRARLHPDSESRILLANISRTSEVDAHTVRLELGSPDAVFLKKLGNIYVVPADSPEIITEPVGTGPYRIVGFSPGQILKLQAFAEYWGAKAQQDSVDFVFIQDRNDALDRLLSGAVDIVTNVSPSSVDMIERSEQHWVESSIGSVVYFLTFNANKPPFDNGLVREAMDFALDRQELAEEVLRNYARPAGQLVNESAFGHAPDLRPLEPNLARARALIASIEGDSPIEFTLEYRPGNEELVQAIKRQIERTGVVVHLEARPWREFLPRFLRGELQAGILTWRSDFADVGFTFDQLVHSGSPSAPATGPSDPLIDQLIVASRSIEDSDERLQLLNSISERVAARRVLVPLVWLMDLYGVRRDVNWEPLPSGVIDLASISRRVE
jgi:peptide/nickel transport system substrate-binding protein